ncbi:hypothetical protein ZWY2020_001766 [Hordeum vulgare]|nr:hypothetical protein ZWY2020_001766 [Hordeum vulgare]
MPPGLVDAANVVLFFGVGAIFSGWGRRLVCRNGTIGVNFHGAKENGSSFEPGPTFSSVKNAQPTQDMQHSGTSTNHGVSASDLDLRFGSFKPASAPAKVDAKLVSHRPESMQLDLEAPPERCLSAVGEAPVRELGAGVVPTTVHDVAVGEVPTTVHGAALPPVAASADSMAAPAPVHYQRVATEMMDVGACTGGDPHELDVSCMALHVDHAAEIRVDVAARSIAVADSQVHVVEQTCMTVTTPDVGGELGAALGEANYGEASLATDGVLTGTVRHALEEGADSHTVSAPWPVEISVDEK